MRGIELSGACLSFGKVGGIGKSVAVAPSIGRVVGADFKIGGFPAPRFETGIKNIANPFKGPENRGYIENRPPSFLEPNIGVINKFESSSFKRSFQASLIKNPFEAKRPTQTISVAKMDLPSGPEAIKITEEWLSVTRQPQKSHYLHGREYNDGSQQKVFGLIIEQRVPRLIRPEILPFPYPEPVVKPKNEAKIQPNVRQIEISKIQPQSAVLIESNKKSVQPRLNRDQENAVGQVIEQKEVLTEEKVTQKSEISEREEVEEIKLKDLFDEETAEIRVAEIGVAIDLAEAEAKKKRLKEIDGPRILKFLRLHIGLISRIARKIGQDGSLDETLEELASRRFSSKSVAKEQTKKLVTQKEPVKRGKEGKAVREGAVERVFKYQLVKRSPKDEVITRGVKKQVQTGTAKVVQLLAVEPATAERRIEDTPLADVFKKAA